MRSRGGGAIAIAGTVLALAAAAPRSVAALPSVEPNDSFQQLASALVQKVASAHPQAPVAVALTGDTTPSGRAVQTAVIGQLAALGLSAFAVEAPSAIAAEELARARGAEALVRLQISVAGGRLVAEGDALGTHVNFWSGSMPTRPRAPAIALMESVPLDLAALALSPQGADGGVEGRGPLVAVSFARVEGRSEALAAGDVDGDGRDELVVLTASALTILGPDGRALGTRDLSGLSPAATATRDPNGALAVYANPARIAYWSATHGQGEQLTWSRTRGWTSMGALSAAPFGSGELVLESRPTPGENTFAAAVSVVRRGVFTLQRPFVTLASRLVGGTPEGLAVFAGGSAVRLHGLPPRADAVSGLGAGSTLVDLDRDGKPRIATSAAAVMPDAEEVRILDAASPEGAPVARAAIPRGRVMQLAEVSVDANTRAIVAAAWLPDGATELWLLRRMP